MAADLIGSNLGPYRILAQIGQGGMATVYKAYQPAMNRHVAIKVLSARFMQDPAFAQRFEREAHTIARLEHPHILPVYDYGTAEDGTTYIAMRYVEAGTLTDLLRQGAFPLANATRTFEQIADALAYAHEQGVVHRDIKPTNVLVDRRGAVFLTDFGLARMVEGSGQLTGTMILGTPAYMAPELIQGQPADERSDIYALGIVLYEMTAGRRPFEAETPVAVMMKHLHDPLPLPRQLNPTIPEAMERAILKALAKNPGDRYPSVAQMAQDVQAAAREAPGPVSATAVTMPAVPRSSAATPLPPPRKAGIWAALGVVAVILVTVILALLLRQQNGARLAQPEPAATPLAQATVPAADRASTVGDGVAPPISPSPRPSAGAVPAGQEPAAQDGAPSAWRHFSNSRTITSLALDGDLIWAGSEGGLVAWNRHNGSFETFTTLSGLPYHTVEALLVTQDGTLWAGTEVAGVLRRQAGVWDLLDEDDGLDSSSVRVLVEIGDNTLLAGTHYAEEAIRQFNGADWRTAAWVAPDLPPLPVPFPKPVVLLADDNGELLAGLADEGGLWYYDGLEWQQLHTANGLSINSLALDGEGRLWVATDQQGGIGYFDGDTFVAVPRLADVTGTVLYTSPEGILWLGTDYGGLWRFDGQNLARYGEEDGLPDGTIRAMVQDEAGVLWLGIYGVGLVRFDGQAFATWAVPNQPPFNSAQQILEAADGRFWFVERWGGQLAGVYDPASGLWDGFEIPGVAIQSLAIGPQGEHWFGTDDGLWRVDPSGARRQVTVADGLPEGEIRHLALDGGQHLWAGTDNGLAFSDLAEGTDHWRDFSAHLPSPRIKVLYTDPDGDLWIGTERDGDLSAGIVWVQGGEVSAVWGAGQPFPESVESIEAMALDGAGHLWASTWGDGIWRLEEKSPEGEWRRIGSGDGAPGSEILSIAAHPDGSLWFGSWYGGLWGYHPQRGWWQLNPADGLPGLSVFSSQVAADGSLWLATEGGIARYRPGG